MEHYKSTLATATIAAFGLLAAAHVLHPGNFERTTYPSRPVAPVATLASDWVDPPATLALAAPTPLRLARSEAETASSAEAMAVPVAWTSVQAPVAEVAPTPQPRRRIAAGHHRKVAQRRAQTRQATLERQAPDSATPPTATAAPRQGRIDPIGDIIRGLGLGSDS